MRDGIINIDKPRGISSYDVIRVIKTLIPDSSKKLGHSGTLDVEASGVLPICIGKATKLIDFFEKDKEYFAWVKLGLVTDTYDVWGKVVKENPIKSPLDIEEIKKVLRSFKGNLWQYPPIYSALHYHGRRLYEIARQENNIKKLFNIISLKKRKVIIYRIKLLHYDRSNNILQLLVRCGSGVYIRSLCHDIGTRLSVGGCLSYLRRLKSGCFTIKKAVALSALNKNNIEKYLLSIDAGVMHLKSVKLDLKLKNIIAHGRTISYPIDHQGWLRLYDTNGNFLGIGLGIKKNSKETFIKPERLVTT